MSELETHSQDAPPAPAFNAAAQPSYAHTLFLGPDGLRPGWGLIFYLATYIALRDLTLSLEWERALGLTPMWRFLGDEISRFVTAAIPALVLMRVERRPWRAYGLPVAAVFGKRFCLGVVWGFAGISLLMFALYGLHSFAFGHIVLHGARVVRFAAYWAVMFLAVGLFEEFFFRGYLQFTLARGIGFWWAALALSCMFGLVHLGNEGEHWSGLLAAGAIGFFFCLTLRRTGNLWFAVGFHAAWDWGETFFYSVPDSGMQSPGHLLSSTLHGPRWLSGGSVGPEGSALCFVVIALTAAAFHRAYPKRMMPPTGP